jgi:hypothetical protein
MILSVSKLIFVDFKQCIYLGPWTRSVDMNSHGQTTLLISLGNETLRIGGWVDVFYVLSMGQINSF